MNKAVEVKNLGKMYTIGEREKYLTLRDLMVKAVKVPGNLIQGKKFKKKEIFWALKEVSFDVEEGDAIGIIGKNGAGKSTLLKILSRITEPTTGEIQINGKISSLLEVGTGFHPELTGRENIYLNGAIMGMKRKEIDAKFDEIVEFSGVERFLDTPVKRYSSGMQVRLAFSVAAHLEPDILVIDEVLAVGDAEFQKKCLGKMDEVTKKAGRTILFVSHDMGAIQRLCKKTILLENGEIKNWGNTSDVIDSYLRDAQNLSSEFYFENDGTKIAKITHVCITNSSGKKINSIQGGEEFFVDVEYSINNPGQVVHTAVILTDYFDRKIFSSESSEKNMIELKPKKEGRYKARFSFPKSSGFYLSSGDYLLRVSVGTPLTKPIDSVSNIQFSFASPPSVIDVPHRVSFINLDAKWRV